jgi:anti-repressor protein
MNPFLTTTIEDNQVLSYENYPIRVRIISGEPWWCAVDICSILGYQNGRRTVADFCSLKGVRKLYTLTTGGEQALTFINEPNLYRLIARSPKPRAKEFEEWIFENVLPSIRKTGGYQLPEDPLEQVILLATRLKEQAETTLQERSARLIAEKTLADEQPKIALAERAICADGMQSLSVAAKELGVGRNKLFSILRDKKILMATNVPYQSFIDRGYFKVKLNTITRGDRVCSIPVTHVTGKGLVYISSLLK